MSGRQRNRQNANAPRRVRNIPEPRLRVQPINEDGDWQERYVQITVKGEFEVYKGGRIEETIEVDETEIALIRFGTENGFKEAVRRQAQVFVNKIQVLEDDSRGKKFTPSSITVGDSIPHDELEAVAQEVDVQEMYRAEPIDNRNLKGADVNRLDPNNKVAFNCVIEYLMKAYGTKERIPTLSRDLIVQIMSNKEFKTAARADEEGRGWSVKDVQRFCEHYKISHYVLDGYCRVVHKWIMSSRNYPALIYYCDDQHMYPITDKKQRAHITKSLAEKSDRHTAILAMEDEKKRLEAEKAAIHMFTKMPQYEDMQVEELPRLSNCVVFYHKLHLKEMLMDMYRREGILHKFKHVGKLVTHIEYGRNNVHLFANVNHKAGCDWKVSQQVAKLLKIPFANQSLPSLTEKYFEMKHHHRGKQKSRVHIPDKIRKKVMRSQDQKCKECKTDLKAGSYQCDHIIPISVGGDPISMSNLQMLCTKCHLEKSRKEVAESLANIDNSCSYFNEKTIDVFGNNTVNGIFHNYFQPDEDGRYRKPVEKGMKGDPLILAGLDMNKSRTMNMLYSNQDPWCCYSVLDDVMPFDEELHEDFPPGFYFVESEMLVPLKGNGWICSPVVRYCLEEKLIEKSQIKYALVSSLTLPAGYFREFVQDIMDVVKDPKLWKLMINSFIGKFGIRRTTKQDFKIKLSKIDAANSIYQKLSSGQTVNIFPKYWDSYSDKSLKVEDVEETKSDEPDFYEVLFNTDRLREESHFPIFAQVLQQEWMECHKMIKFMEGFGGVPIHVNTDAVICGFESQKQIDAMWADASKLAWDSKGKVLKYKMCGEAINNSKRQEELNTSVYKYEKPRYNKELDPGNDDFEKLAKRLYKHGQSFQVDAMAGCGKTTLLREFMKILDEQGETWLACTPTHKSSRVLHEDSKTIHAALGMLRFGSSHSFTKFRKYKWIIIDEKSMLKESFFGLLYKIKKACPETKVILSGDWNQLPPVLDRSASFAYKNSFVVYDLCDGNMMKLTKCRRSDKALFNLYSDIKKADAYEFPDKINSMNICYFNSTRKALNTYWMKKMSKGLKTMLLRRDKVVKQSQDMLIFDGLPVIAATTRSKYNFANCDEFDVIGFNDKLIRLRSIVDEEIKIDVPAAEFTQLMQPRYAITAHRCQGSSLDVPHSIWDYSKMDEKLKYVALSRSRLLSLISVCSDDQLDKLKM